jgi:hypothetical protein
MKTNGRSFAVPMAALATAASVACHSPREEATSEQGTFEGTIQMLMPGADARPVVFWVKGSKVRWDLVSGDESQGYRVYDEAAQKLFTVEPQVPSVLVSDLPAHGDGEAEAGAGWSVVAVKTDAIAGYPCDRVRATNDKSTYDVCAARGMPVLPVTWALPELDKAVPFLDVLAARGQTPLAVIKQSDKAEATAVALPLFMTTQLRRTPVDASRFQIPGYPQSNVHLAPPKAHLR